MFMAVGEIAKDAPVFVIDGTFAAPVRPNVRISGSYVYGIAVSAAKAREMVAVDIGDAIERKSLTRSLDGVEGELEALVREVERG